MNCSLTLFSLLFPHGKRGTMYHPARKSSNARFLPTLHSLAYRLKCEAYDKPMTVSCVCHQFVVPPSNFNIFCRYYWMTICIQTDDKRMTRCAIAGIRSGVLEKCVGFNRGRSSCRSTKVVAEGRVCAFLQKLTSNIPTYCSEATPPPGPSTPPQVALLGDQTQGHRSPTDQTTVD